MKIELKTLATILVLTAMNVADASAHGINGHVWVTDGAVEHTQECAVRTLMELPGVREKLQIGAAFPDTGYATEEGRGYGETAHWEPFTQAYIEYLQVHYGPDFSDPHARDMIAFLMGFSSHGIEDEIFDTFFLRWSLEKEGTDQDILDMGTDIILTGDGHTNLHPPVWYPLDELLEIYSSEAIGLTVDPEVIETGFFAVDSVVLGFAESKTPEEAAAQKEEMPWSKDAFLDPRVPGSHAFEKFAVGPYHDVLWRRLRGETRPQDVLMQVAPLDGVALDSTDPTRVGSRIGVISGIGVQDASLTSATVKLKGPDGQYVPIEVFPNRWGNKDNPGNYTRAIEIRPTVALVPDSDYTVELHPGLKLVDGSETTEIVSRTLRSGCGDPAACPQSPMPAVIADPDCGGYELPLAVAPDPTGDTPGCSLNPRASALGAGAWLTILLGLVAALHLRRRA